ncbi:MAG TPA: hypothetical protein PKL97_02985 [Candidatus Omnitrophota bacterium]|nr:hypothetical protein [Candidatus Omnitrophota bacterium]
METVLNKSPLGRGEISKKALWVYNPETPFILKLELQNMKLDSKRILLSLSAFIFASPSLAYADLVWPAMYLEQRILSWWVISAGLLVEYLFVRKITSFGVTKSALVTFCMNLASTLLGIILIPLAGIGWELFPGTFLYPALRMGTFNPYTWIATCLSAILVNTVIESLVMRWAFKNKIGRKGFGWLYLANTVSVGLAFGSLWIMPMRY